MHSNEAVLIALLVVLVLVVAYQGLPGGGCRPGCDCHRCRRRGHFVDGPEVEGLEPVPAGVRAMDAAVRGVPNGGNRQDHPYYNADLGKNYQAWSAGPRDLEEAQRAAWFEAVSDGNNAGYNAEAGGSIADEMMQYHTPGPSINYQDAIVDLVADSRMREQHANWHGEVAPKSKTAMSVDDLDEAAAMSNYRGHGIYAFRMQAPSQHNPLFVTDQDAQSYGPHSTKFSFGG